MERIKQRRIYEGSILVIICLWIIFTSVGFLCKKRNLEDSMSKLFTEAIQEEKSIYIKRLINKQVQNVPTGNNIPKHEKDEWVDQYYLIRKDPKREQLDSIYSSLLIKNGIQTEVEVLCTLGGRSTFTGSLDQLEKATALPSVSFTLNGEEKDRIVLHPYYANIFWYDFLVTPYSVLSFLCCSFICLILIWHIKKLKKQKVELSQKDDILEEPLLNRNKADSVSVEELLPKQPVCSLSPKMHITGNYYWDERNRTLCYKDKKAVLNGFMLSYFKLFIQSEGHTVSYADILSLYGEPAELSTSTKNKIYQAIGNLKKLLHEMPLKIESITNVGYRICFNEEEEKA